MTVEELKGRQLYRAVGCPNCVNTGYLGRLAIHELLIIDDEMRGLVMKNVDATTIKKAAMAKGMMTLREDGIQKVIAGITDLKELVRVVDMTDRMN